MSEISLAETMRAIFETGRVTHAELVKLRRKAIETAEWGDVEAGAVAMVMLKRVEAGREVGGVLRMTRGKLVKLARKVDREG